MADFDPLRTLAQIGNKLGFRHSPDLMATQRMSAQHFRERARKCREVAEEVREPNWLKLLLELAEDLEDEANKIEAEDRAS